MQMAVLLLREHLAMVGEGNKPEAIIPLDTNKRSRALDLLAQVASRFLGDVPSTNISTNNDVINQLVKQTELMQQQLNVMMAIFTKDNNVYLDSKQLKKGIDNITNKENKMLNMARGLT